MFSQISSFFNRTKEVEEDNARLKSAKTAASDKADKEEEEEIEALAQAISNSQVNRPKAHSLFHTVDAIEARGTANYHTTEA